MSGSDDPEEIRKRIEAQLAGQNLGFLIGIVLALLKEDKETTEQQKQTDEQEQIEQQDEEQTDEMQMA